MSRITAPADVDVPEASRPALEAAERELGFLPIMHRALSASPKALNAWLDLMKALSSTLDAKTRQGIAHAVTEVNGCSYCDAIHSFVSREMTKLDDGEIALNRKGTSRDPKRGAAIAFARQVTAARGKVEDSDLAAVRAAGFTDAQVLEIVALVAQFSMTNLFNNVMQTDIDVFPSRR